MTADQIKLCVRFSFIDDELRHNIVKVALYYEKSMINKSTDAHKAGFNFYFIVWH